MSIFEQLAESYERVASLPDVNLDAGGRISGKPGSRVPPGASTLLDADEYRRAVNAVDVYALYVVNVLIDEVPGIGSVPDETPGRLRVASRWAAELRGLPPQLWYSVWADARDRLADMRRLERRGTRQVRTESACLTITCAGTYVAEQEPDEERDWVLICSGCGDKVSSDVFSRWGARTEWITVDRAMTLLGVTRQGVYQRAKREKWRRRGGQGRDVRYHVGDIMDREERESA
jgi:hypothetical protein